MDMIPTPPRRLFADDTSERLADLTFNRAAAFVGSYYILAAREACKRHGYTHWVETAKAPDSFEDLFAMFVWTVSTGRPFEVNGDFCETAPTGKIGNVAFRVMHDLSHIATGYGFGWDDEIHLGRLTYADWLASDFRRLIIERGEPSHFVTAMDAVVWCDMIGQASLGKLLSEPGSPRFVEDQTALARNVWLRGEKQTIEAVLELAGAAKG